MMSSTYK